MPAIEADVDAPPVALVSGANKGIGLAIARGLAQRGHRVLLGCRDPGRGEAAAAALRDEGLAAAAIPLDVADDASIAAAAASIEAQHGRLDVLVNNAGVALDRRIGEEPLRAVLRQTFEVNVFGLACLTEAMAPLLARSAHPRVVNVGSSLGSLARVDDGEYAAYRIRAYNASKAAVSMLTLVYADRLAASGVKVNVVCPGYVATDLTDHQGPRTPQQGAAVAIRLATIGDDGPSGKFFDEDGSVPW